MVQFVVLKIYPTGMTTQDWLARFTLCIWPTEKISDRSSPMVYAKAA